MYDDEFQVIYNADIQEISFQNVKKIFTSSILDMYQPLVTTSFMLEYFLWGQNPEYYHIISLIWHFLCLAAGYKILQQLRINRTSRIFIILLIGSAPINVEAVAWISARSTLMFSAFFLIGLLFLIRYKNDQGKKNLIYSLISVSLALLCKVTASTFLPLAIVILFPELRKKDRYSYLFISALALLVLLISIIGVQFRPPENLGVTLNPWDAIKNLLWYISAVFPTLRYSVIYPRDVITITRLLPGLFLLGCSFFLLKSLKARNSAIKAWVFGAIVILPFILINTYKSPVNDRYAYLFSFSMILIFFLGIDHWFPRFKFLLLTAILIVFSLVSFKTIANWKYNVSLWENASKYNNNFRAYEQYVKALEASGDSEKADQVATYYLEKYPEFDEMRIIRAYFLYKDGRFGDSMESISEIRNPSLEPDILCLKAYNNLGLNKSYTALELIDKAISQNPNNGEYYYVRALAKSTLSRNYCSDIKKATQLEYRVAEDMLNRCNH